MSTIVGATPLVTDGTLGPVTDQQRDLLNRARSAAHHLRGLLRSTLEQARIAPAESHDEWVDLVPLVAETTAMVEPGTRSAGLVMELRRASEKVMIQTDAIRVRQVLLNLLGNAVKYTNEGGVQVAVETSDRDSVRVVVRDTGAGIAPEHLKRIFERHWRGDHRGDDTNERARQGAGLGLAISRELARELGGDIGVDSAPGRGSTFTLTLPRT